MRKTLLLLTIFFIVCVSKTQAQVPFDKGERIFNFGLGFYVALEYAVHQDVTIGVQSDFSLMYKENGIGIVGRGDYHFNTILNLPTYFDLYAGLSFGFWDGPHSAGQIGARYFFNQKWAANLEFGASNIANGRFGLSMKF
jgi:outer membrane immunogenic protein